MFKLTFIIPMHWCTTKCIWTIGQSIFLGNTVNLFYIFKPFFVVVYQNLLGLIAVLSQLQKFLILICHLEKFLKLLLGKAVLICFDFPGNHPWPIHFQQSCSVECFTESGFNYQCLSVSFSKDPEQLNWEHMWAVELWTWANNYYLLTFQIRGNSILIHFRGTIMCVLIYVFHTFFYFKWQIN